MSFHAEAAKQYIPELLLIPTISLSTKAEAKCEWPYTPVLLPVEDDTKSLRLERLHAVYVLPELVYLNQFPGHTCPRYVLHFNNCLQMVQSAWLSPRA